MDIDGHSLPFPPFKVNCVMEAFLVRRQVDIEMRKVTDSCFQQNCDVVIPHMCHYLIQLVQKLVSGYPIAIEN